MDIRIQEALVTLSRLYPKEHLDKKDLERGLNDKAIAHNMAQNMSMSETELLEYPEVIDAYRQKIKINRLLKQST